MSDPSTTSTTPSTDRAGRGDFERLWQQRGAPPAGPPGAPRDMEPDSFDPEEAPATARSVLFDPATVAMAARHAAAVKAATQSGAALSAAARRGATASPQALLRATAANGAALASAVVSLSALDATVLAGATTIAGAPAGAPGASRLDDPLVAAAFLAAAPAEDEDDARVARFVAEHPAVGVTALVEHAARGEERAASVLRRLEASAPLAGALGAGRGAMEQAARATDEALLGALRGRSVQTIADVIALMRRIEALLPDGDGLKWFNLLYRLVTEGVAERIARGAWESPRWLTRLDVVFAELYFSGLERCLAAPETAPRAWRALLDARRRTGIARVQFALAGMSAHINRDLAVAVTRTSAAEGIDDFGRGTPEFRDYKRVDALLSDVEPQAMRVLATGIFKLLDDLFGTADDWAAMQIICTARDLAWTHAQHLAALGPEGDAGHAYVGLLDGVAAGVAQAALVPVW